MITFVLRRVLSGILLVLTLSFLTFFVFNEIPTSPACLVVACGPHTTTNDAQVRAAEHSLGIDRSVFTQYGDWLWHIVRSGDFGASWTTKTSVGSMLGGAIPVTASLVAGGMLLMLLLALPLGALAATRPRTPTDRGILAVSVIGLAVHPFVLAIFVRDWIGHHTGYYDFSYRPLTADPLAWAGHLLVPWLVFALFFVPLYMRMLRVRLLETYSEPYISTARAKGASELRVLRGHALRNAVGPVLPMLAIDAGTAITAAIYVETVFGMQGLGALAVRALSGAAGGYDLPLIAAIVAVVGTFVVLLNLAADAGGAWIDPRIRQRAASGLVPLPRAIEARPRIRLALNLGVVAVLVLAVAVAVAAKPKTSGGAVTLGSPVRVHAVKWEDYTRIFAAVPVKGQPGSVGQTGVLELDTQSVEIGPTGWRVHAKLVNNSPLRIRTLGAAPAGTVSAYPDVPFSLVVQTDTGTGIKTLEPLPASQFVPSLPAIIDAHGTWQGTFAGSGVLGRGQLFYVGIGQFFYADSPSQTLPFSLVSHDSAKG